jgi:hypothetical protein
VSSRSNSVIAGVRVFFFFMTEDGWTTFKLLIGAGDMAQAIECCFASVKPLSSNPSPTKINK